MITATEGYAQSPVWAEPKGRVSAEVLSSSDQSRIIFWQCAQRFPATKNWQDRRSLALRR